MTDSSITPSLTVADFLAQHPALVPLVAEAQQAVQVYFLAASLVLEVFADPEFGDPLKLHLTIVPTTEPPDAVARYQQFQRAWWGTAAPRAQGHFAIVLEYR